MKYVAFLRGVNVGGNSKVDMKILVSNLKNRNEISVSSILNSGNLLMESNINGLVLESIITEILNNEFKIPIKTFVIEYASIIEILNNIPFSTNENEKSKQLVYILEKTIDETILENIKNDSRIFENIYLYKNYLYVYYTNGIGRSKLTTKYIEDKLMMKTTGRNINTIKLIHEKGKS